MNKLITGLLWILLSIAIFVIFARDGDFLVLAIVLFVISVSVFIKGAISIIKDKLTEKNGVYSIGKILQVYPVGISNTNGNLHNAEVAVCLPNREIKTFVEEIGFPPFAYQADDYVKVKYYNSDINIIGIVDDFDIPDSIKKDLSYIKPSKGLNTFS